MLLLFLVVLIPGDRVDRMPSMAPLACIDMLALIAILGLCALRGLIDMGPLIDPIETICSYCWSSGFLALHAHLTRLAPLARFARLPVC